MFKFWIDSNRHSNKEIHVSAVLHVSCQMLSNFLKLLSMLSVLMLPNFVHQTSIRELTTLGIKNAENLAIPSVRNDVSFQNCFLFFTFVVSNGIYT